MLSPDAAEFVPRGGSPIYGDAPDDDMQPVKIGGKDMIVGGYGEYAIQRDITKNKYNPGAIFEKYSGSTYITESIIISRILKEKPKNTDAFQTALTKLSNTIDDVNNVYSHEDVISDRINPKIIAKYVKTGDSYSIPEYNI